MSTHTKRKSNKNNSNNTKTGTGFRRKPQHRRNPTLDVEFSPSVVDGPRFVEAAALLTPDDTIYRIVGLGNYYKPRRGVDPLPPVKGHALIRAEAKKTPSGRRCVLWTVSRGNRITYRGFVAPAVCSGFRALGPSRAWLYWLDRTLATKPISLRWDCHDAYKKYRIGELEAAAHIYQHKRVKLLSPVAATPLAPNSSTNPANGPSNLDLRLLKKQKVAKKQSMRNAGFILRALNKRQNKYLMRRSPKVKWQRGMVGGPLTHQEWDYVERQRAQRSKERDAEKFASVEDKTKAKPKKEKGLSRGKGKKPKKPREAGQLQKKLRVDPDGFASKILGLLD